MKFERISENKIRITLTGEDLAQRHIRLTELAYGSDKAKSLFREMMKQARLKFGFEADNIPLMIEAIPVSEGSITIYITKVEDPEELDTRFSKFSTPKGASAEELQIEDADDILRMIQKLYDAKQKAASPKEEAPEEVEAPKTINLDYTRVFRFKNIDRVIDAALALNMFYDGPNSLYKGNGEYPYTLILHKDDHSAEDFNKVCNIISEFSKNSACTPAAEAHLREHDQCVFDGNALQALATLK